MNITLTLLVAGALVSGRPAPADRLFVSESVEKTITEVQTLIANPYLAHLFSNCFPNTLDTTVYYDENGNDGMGDTIVYTGDIHAMWLRDSAAQVWPYLQFCNEDEHLKKMIAGLIRRDWICIATDPYANAFYKEPNPDGEWKDDVTGAPANPLVHERKWEIDSHCYPIRLAYNYWKITGDDTVFGESWIESIKTTLRTFKEQQRKDGPGPYIFLRETDAQLDTKSCKGHGSPVKPCGLIASSFRPSDDATTFEFLIPSNFFAVSALKQAAEILTKVNGRKDIAAECTALADEVSAALKKHAVVNHPVCGKIYAYEVDGFGNALTMDDSNSPSLLSMPYLGIMDPKDKIWQNTRKFVLSDNNPFFFKGTAAEGIGGPHVGYRMIWPMSIMMRAFTSTDDQEIKECIKTLMTTDAGTGFMHESFDQDDPSKFTRSWFAWQNSMFGELILKLIREGKLDLLNSIN